VGKTGTDVSKEAADMILVNGENKESKIQDS
jgi:cation transport ATPase